MRLHNLVKSEGSTHRRKRVGRGEGSGRGKTSTRGGKGQSARSGSSLRPGFESGHVPLYRRLPKRGFNHKRFDKVEWTIVNVGALEGLPADVKDIDKGVLVDFGLSRDDESLIKFLGTGDLTRAFTVRAQKFSASAKEKIIKAGGQVIELVATAPEAEGESSGQA